MTIQDILKLDNSQIGVHINELANDYYKLTNNTICKSCKADIHKMLNHLKKHYSVVNFQLRKPNVIYKLQTGSPITISNSVMTDELAIEFLKINPERIKLFSMYPSNWDAEILENEPKKEASKTTKKTTKKPCKNCKKKQGNNSKKTTNDK